MKKQFLVWFGLAIAMSVVGFGNLSGVGGFCGDSEVQAETISFFFAEAGEGASTPTAKTAWEIVNGETKTLNLWATTDFTKAADVAFMTRFTVDFSYLNGAESGDFKQTPAVVGPGAWRSAFNQIPWGIFSSSNDLDMLWGIGNTGSSQVLDPGTYFLGAITLSVADGVTLSDGATFAITLNTNASSGSSVLLGGVAQTINFTETTVRVKEAPVVPEPGTWAMLAGMGLIGGAWLHRRRK